jgi:hypothetical protein
VWSNGREGKDSFRWRLKFRAHKVTLFVGSARCAIALRLIYISAFSVPREKQYHGKGLMVAALRQCSECNCESVHSQDSSCIAHDALRNVYIDLLVHLLWKKYSLSFCITSHSHSVPVYFVKHVAWKHHVEECSWYWCRRAFIHAVVCLTTGPYSSSKQDLHRMRSSASSFNFQYPVFP